METITKRLNIDNFSAHMVTFTPDQEVRAGAVLVHGQGDFTERYHSVAEVFCQYGIQVIGVDLPGHGETSGTKGDIPSMYVAEKFVDAAYYQLLENNPQVPIGILGHSVGALIGIRELLENKRAYEFAWFNAPFLFPEERKNSFQIAAFKVLEKLLPRVTISTGVKRQHCRQSNNKNPDPLYHSSISLRWGVELIRHAAAIRKSSTTLQQPILITQGGSDPISIPHLNTAFFTDSTWPNIQYNLIPNSLHEPFLDTPEEFAEILTKWCKEEFVESLSSVS